MLFITSEDTRVSKLFGLEISILTTELVYQAKKWRYAANSYCERTTNRPTAVSQVNRTDAEINFRT